MSECCVCVCLWPPRWTSFKSFSSSLHSNDSVHGFSSFSFSVSALFTNSWWSRCPRSGRMWWAAVSVHLLPTRPLAIHLHYPVCVFLSTYLFLGGFRHGTCSVAFTCMAAVALTLFVTLYFNLSVFFLFFFFCFSDDIGVCLHLSFRPRTVLDVFEFSSVHFAASR